MHTSKRLLYAGVLTGGMAGALLLLCAGSASAQFRTNPSGSSGSSGSAGLGSSGGSSGGQGFSGGSSGGQGFAGNSGGMGNVGSTGGLGNTGGLSNGIGSTGGTGSSGGRGGSGSGVISTNNPFQQYYANPLSLGVASGTGSSASTKRATFGQPLYTTTTTTNNQQRGTANISSNQNQNQAQAPVGGSSIGVRRAPSYVTQIAFAPSSSIPGPLALRADLQALVAQSSRLASREKIQVLADGKVVVLRGEVLDDHERQLAESIVRLTPGVQDVRNELQIPGAAPDAGTGQ